MSTSSFELGINKVFMLAIAALLSWNVWMTQALTVEVAVIKSKADQIESTRFTSVEGALLTQKVKILADQLQSYKLLGDYPK